MEIQATTIDRNLLLELSGELDHPGARKALRELEQALDAALPRKLVLDLEGVTFMDSSGIGVVIGRCKNVRFSGGYVRAVNLNGQIRRIFKLSGLQKIIEVEQEETEGKGMGDFDGTEKE